MPHQAFSLVVEGELDRLALECLEQIEVGLLSTGWTQYYQVELAGHDQDVIWTGGISNSWRQSRWNDGYSLCWLDLVMTGGLLVKII
jgi:hypothetical protein